MIYALPVGICRVPEVGIITTSLLYFLPDHRIKIILSFNSFCQETSQLYINFALETFAEELSMNKIDQSSTRYSRRSQLPIGALVNTYRCGVSDLSSFGIDCITNYKDLGERVPRWPDIH
jgi:hypothetical protein